MQECLNPMYFKLSCSVVLYITVFISAYIQRKMHNAVTKLRKLMTHSLSDNFMFERRVQLSLRRETCEWLESEISYMLYLEVTPMFYLDSEIQGTAVYTHL